MGRVPLYRDDAVVLRVHKLGEADRIVTLLTRRHGRVRAVGKGVRRTSSRSAPGSNRAATSTCSSTPRLAREARRLRAGGVASTSSSRPSRWARSVRSSPTTTRGGRPHRSICETAERLTEEGEPALRLYLLVVGALRALVEREHDPGLVLDAFLIRAMATSGGNRRCSSAPSARRPARTRRSTSPAGGAVCDNCRPAGSARPQPATIELMVALLGGDWASPTRASGSVRREAAVWSPPTCSGTSSAGCARCRSSTARRDRLAARRRSESASQTEITRRDSLTG